LTWLKEKSPFIIFSAVLGAGMIVFLLLPFGSLANSAGGIPAALLDPRTEDAIVTSFYCALLATFFAFVLGVPFAYLFTRYEFRGKKLMDSLIDLPILIPHNAAGIALIAIFSSGSLVGGIFGQFGVHFVDTILGVVVAMAFVSAPFMIRSAQEAFTSIDPKMEYVARSLGASRFNVFKDVILPSALKGILTGCILTWARAVSEFGAVVTLAYYPMTAPVYLDYVYASEGLQAALPITGLLLILAVIALIVFRLVTGRPAKLVR
jgi:molybdate/tungstate transport system permease protein